WERFHCRADGCRSVGRPAYPARDDHETRRCVMNPTQRSTGDVRKPWMRARVTLTAGFALATLAANGAATAGTVGTALPADFPVITDASLRVPVIGFGAAGGGHPTPRVFLPRHNPPP